MTHKNNKQHLQTLSNALIIFCGLCILLTIASITSIFMDTSTSLALEAEPNELIFRLHDLPHQIKNPAIGIEIIYELIWLFLMTRILSIAYNAKKGDVFNLVNYKSLEYAGYSLCILSVISTGREYVIGHLISRYMEEFSAIQINWAGTLELELIMAGIFFCLLGKILHYASDLEDVERYTV